MQLWQNLDIKECISLVRKVVKFLSFSHISRPPWFSQARTESNQLLLFLNCTTSTLDESRPRKGTHPWRGLHVYPYAEKITIIHCIVLHFTCINISIHIWASSRENLSSGVCEQQRRRPACASAQSDQCLCYSLATNKISNFYLVFVAEEAVFSLHCWKPRRQVFSRRGPII